MHWDRHVCSWVPTWQLWHSPSPVTGNQVGRTTLLYCVYLDAQDPPALPNVTGTGQFLTQRCASVCVRRPAWSCRVAEHWLHRPLSYVKAGQSLQSPIVCSAAYACWACAAAEVRSMLVQTSHFMSCLACVLDAVCADSKWQHSSLGATARAQCCYHC